MSEISIEKMCETEAEAEVLAHFEGKKVKWKDELGFGLFHAAAHLGNIEALEAAKKARISINCLDSAGETPLFKAIRSGRVAAVEWLLERKASVVKKNKSRETVMHVVVQSGQRPFKRDLPNKAAPASYLDIATQLLAKNAKINQRNQRYELPLEDALNYAEQGMVKLLLRSGAQWEYRSLAVILSSSVAQAAKLELFMEDASPLQLSQGLCQVYSLEEEAAHLAKRLLQRGADPNWTDDEGFSALTQAAMWGLDDLAEVMLRYGAHGNTKTSGPWEDDETVYGKTPMAIAKKNGHDGVVRLMKAAKKGFDLIFDLGIAGTGRAFVVAGYKYDGWTMSAIQAVGEWLQKESRRIGTRLTLVPSGDFQAIRNEGGKGEYPGPVYIGVLVADDSVDDSEPTRIKFDALQAQLAKVQALPEEIWTSIDEKAVSASRVDEGIQLWAVGCGATAMVMKGEALSALIADERGLQSDVWLTQQDDGRHYLLPETGSQNGYSTGVLGDLVGDDNSAIQLAPPSNEETQASEPARYWLFAARR